MNAKQALIERAESYKVFSISSNGEMESAKRGEPDSLLDHVCNLRVDETTDCKIERYMTETERVGIKLTLQGVTYLLLPDNIKHTDI